MAIGPRAGGPPRYNIGGITLGIFLACPCIESIALDTKESWYEERYY